MNLTLLLNHLWQSTAFLAAAAILAWALRQRAARVRFWVWMAASLKFLVPFGALAALGGWLGALAPAGAGAAAVSAAPVLAKAAAQLQVWIEPAPAAAATAAAGLSPWWLAAGAVWTLGAMLLALRWWRSWRRLAALARQAEPAKLAGAAVLLTGAGIEPGVVGILRPRILLPRDLPQRLEPPQLAAVMAHEHCHIGRRDNLWSALHMAVECLFWFHPLVWWLGARLVAERERACDEAIVASGGNRAAYAGGMIAVCSYYLESPLACAAGISGGGLRARVARVLDGHWGRNLSRTQQTLLATLAALALALPLAAGFMFQQAPTAPAVTEFDAATLKPAPPPGAGPRQVIMVGVRTDPQHLTGSNVTLALLLQRAYNLQPYQIQGPDWIAHDRYNLSAETAAPVSEAQMFALLQPFLTKEFHLTLRHTTKIESVFALVVANGGPKLKPATGTAPVPPSSFAKGKLPKGLQGGLPPGQAFMRFDGQAMRLFLNDSMSGLAEVLSRQLNRPVKDETGLKGSYFVDLSYAPPVGMDIMRMGSAPARSADSGRGGSQTSAPAPTIYSALEHELGLKLVSRNAPVEMLVIDQAQKIQTGGK